MIKQIILPLVGVALFIIIVGAFTQKSAPFSLSKYINAPSSVPGKNMTVGGKTIHIEIANTSDSRAKGLSGRNSLSEGSGMLFVFETKGVNPDFWMKDMLIPLDIIWISGGRVVKIDSNVPKPIAGTPDDQLKVYNGGQPVDYVLEVNSGYSTRNNIKIGDSVVLPTL